MFIQDSESRIISRSPFGLVYWRWTNRRVTPTQGRAGTQLAETDLHIRSYAPRHTREYADTTSASTKITQTVLTPNAQGGQPEPMPPFSRTVCAIFVCAVPKLGGGPVLNLGRTPRGAPRSGPYGHSAPGTRRPCRRAAAVRLEPRPCIRARDDCLA